MQMAHLKVLENFRNLVYILARESEQPIFLGKLPETVYFFFFLKIQLWITKKKNVAYHSSPTSESHFLGRLIRSLGVPKERRGLEFSRRKKGQTFCPSTFLGIV